MSPRNAFRRLAQSTGWVAGVPRDAAFDLHFHRFHSELLSSLSYRGLYLTSIIYREDKIFVTSEDQLPIVEIEDCYSSSLMQDFLWFTKVCQFMGVSFTPNARSSR